MDKKFDNSIFIFKSNQAEIRIDTISTSPSSSQEIILKVSSKDTPLISFAYESQNGLIRIGSLAKRSSNILGEFLKIDSNDLQGFLNFFKINGFLFPLKKDQFIAINPQEIRILSERLNALVELINETNKVIDKNYIKILELSLYLLFGDTWEIKNDFFHYSSAHYSLVDKIENAFDQYPNEKINKQEQINNINLTINDVIYGKYEFPYYFYQEIVNDLNSKEEYDNFRFKSIAYLYVNDFLSDKTEQEIITLLFHYFYNVGVPKEITSSFISYYSNKNIKNFNTNWKDSILLLARYVIKNEINSSIQYIKPVYNETEMKPDWKIDSLYSAMCFSIFYLDSEQQMWRKCKHCGQLFLVKRSNSKKVYCDNYCRNNAQQANHRIKVKNSKNV
ncbi:MAG: hypothetical protein NC087_04245 [Anaeroplasma bactoclasticum]|nr:hypothetical protein [Anaeroplasma bactoclasticum]